MVIKILIALAVIVVVLVVVVATRPPMTAEQGIVGGLLHHIDDRFGSIRKTVGH